MSIMHVKPQDFSVKGWLARYGVEHNDVIQANMSCGNDEMIIFALGSGDGVAATVICNSDDMETFSKMKGKTRYFTAEIHDISKVIDWGYYLESLRSS